MRSGFANHVGVTWRRFPRPARTAGSGKDSKWPGAPAGGGPWPYTGPYAAPVGPAATKEQELDALKGQAEYFEDALEGIRKRIEEPQTQAPEEAE